MGFQRPNNAQNFVRLVRQRVGHKTHRDLVYLPDGRIVQAAAFPISIDVEGLEELARSDSVAQRAKEIREQLGNPENVLLGVDRLDYTKGIYSRLRAYGELLTEGRLSVEDTVFVQVATPRGSAWTRTAGCATTSTASSAGSTATWAGSAAPRSPTCTPPTRGTRWRRCSGRPTSAS